MNSEIVFSYQYERFYQVCRELRQNIIELSRPSLDLMIVAIKTLCLLSLSVHRRDNERHKGEEYY